MLSQKTKGGVHAGARGSKGGGGAGAGAQTAGDDVTVDVEKLLASQDLAYVRAKRSVERRRLAKLKGSLHFLDAPRQNTHTLFLDDGAAVANFDAAEHFDTPAELAGRHVNRPRKATLREAGPVARPTRKALKKAARKKFARYAEVEARLQRADKLEMVEAHLETRKALRGKGRRRKVASADGDRPAVFKWRTERKR